MQFEITHSPTFAILRVDMDEGEFFFAQPSSMLSMTSGVEISTKVGAQHASRNWLGGWKNLLTGESIFTVIYRAKTDGQQVTLAPEDIGEVLELPVDDQHGYYLTRGAYLAGSPDTKSAVKYGGMQGMLARKGLFLMHVTGEGAVFCASHGAVIQRELADGERFVIDNRFVIAFSDTIQYKLVKATENLKHSVFSGEGLVNRYTGPGTVYYQTRGKQTVGFFSRVFDAVT